MDPLIFYRLGYLPWSSSSLCHAPKNFSNQHIFAYSKGNEADRLKRRVFNLFSRHALPTTRARSWTETGMKSGTRSTMYEVQDLLLHVGKPVRESDTRFVPPWQAYSSFREFIPQFTARSRARKGLPFSPRVRRISSR